MGDDSRQNNQFSRTAADFSISLASAVSAFSPWVDTCGNAASSSDGLSSDSLGSLLAPASAALSAGINSAWNDSATSFSNSSMLGSSLTSFSPKRMRNSLVVL